VVAADRKRPAADPSLVALGAARDDLALFEGVLADEIGAAFQALVQEMIAGGAAGPVRQTWGRLFALLADEGELAAEPLVGDAWQNHLLDRLLVDENAYSRKAQRAPVEAMGPALVEQAQGELRALQRLFQADARRLQALVEALAPAASWPSWDGFRPLEAAAGPGQETAWALKTRLAESEDWAAELPLLAAHYAHAGTGQFARYRAFRWLRTPPPGHLEGISHPDPVRLDELVGYESERELLLQNTEHFLSGYPANNVLLYGDRGTGKSSTIKALLAAYGDRGLRLVEIAKGHLTDLPVVLRLLRDRRERFILFIDDLSFQETETEYKALKAVLEGGLEARPENVLLYATSNRRHLVQERFADRSGAVDGELHGVDTAQEKLSLSDRFGITLTFLAPDQDRFLTIVAALAAARRLPIDAATLRRRALAWATRHKGRSGRTARQFVDHLSGELGLAGAVAGRAEGDGAR
jgi:predicted AAA+ superfamily ATPase